MLSLVGDPCAINPDARLRAHAREQGWRVRDYRTGRKAARAGLVVGAVAGAVTGAVAAGRRRRGAAPLTAVPARQWPGRHSVMVHQTGTVPHRGLTRIYHGDMARSRPDREGFACMARDERDLARGLDALRAAVVAAAPRSSPPARRRRAADVLLLRDGRPHRGDRGRLRRAARPGGYDDADLAASSEDDEAEREPADRARRAGPRRRQGRVRAALRPLPALGLPLPLLPHPLADPRRGPHLGDVLPGAAAA